MLELDVTEPEHVDRGARALAERWGRVDGALHAIGFAPPSCLGGDFMEAAWEDVAIAVQISTYSLKTLADVGRAADDRRRLDRRARLRRHGRLAGLRLDGRRQGRASSRPPATWPATSGPQGIRVNLVAAGPVKTHRGQVDPRLRQVRGRVGRPGAARLGRQATPSAVAQACVALLSDWFPTTTGEIIHVDGGYHAIGA